MSITLPDLISRYFDVQAERDTDALLALFGEDATVVDEGTTRHGLEEIQAWRDGRPRTPTQRNSSRSRSSDRIATSSPAA